VLPEEILIVMERGGSLSSISTSLKSGFATERSAEFLETEVSGTI
jgi:hypothetical protein